MSRTLTFEFIADDRLPKPTYQLDLVIWDTQLKQEISKFDGIKLIDYPIRRIEFPSATQYRRQYKIKKQNNKITWNNIYGMVNGIHVSVFDFI